MTPILPIPIYQSRPWGGDRLRTVFGRETPAHTGESWELSVHDHGVSRDAEGTALRERYPDLHLIFKLLDAQEALSVQVHPAEGSEAKTEMWIVLDAEPGAKLYAGVKDGVPKEELRRRIADQTLPEALCCHTVRPGDVFFLRGGTVHALGGGLLVAEIQQPGDCTYRLYDWGRPRELHIDAGLAAASVGAAPVCARIPEGEGRTVLPGCAWFAAEAVKSKTGFASRTDGEHTILFLRTPGTVKTADGEVRVPGGTTVFLPSDAGEYAVSGENGTDFLLFRQPKAL
ncbi:MAG: class I mannose-6-phosphate isomerase [Eubacteriales bacterium]|nr:class I mannose-6-phosphate isomerase [Clostridiales bacterium]MDY3072014.1 class I mannose-6-phosphate isomerase [Eubacteriales bacterium]